MPLKNCIIHPEIEPNVITVELIKSVLPETNKTKTAEAARLLKSEGIPWNEIDYIRIEQKNILRINNLWMLINLKKLVLSNNRIEKIENLDQLINLIELDLSNNFITKIENLEKLEKLEVLLLYSNRIHKLENLGNLEKLMIFNIGDNLISDLKEVLNLRIFDNLKSVNFAGNPCCNEVTNIREWVAAFLPKIKYYEYKLIKPTDLSKFEREIEQVEESEREISEEKQRKKAEAEEEALNVESFVEFLGDSTLFDKMFDGDIDGQLLLQVPVPDIDEKFLIYKKKFCNTTLQLFQMGQEAYKLRRSEVDQFRKCVEREKIRTEKESKEIVEEFMDGKEELVAELLMGYDNLEEEETHTDFDQYQKVVSGFNATVIDQVHHFREICNDVWYKLMNGEMDLHAQIEEINENFSIIITEMLTTFIEKASNTFTELRTFEKEFNEAILELVTEYVISQTSSIQSRSNSAISTVSKNTRDFEKLFGDKDYLLSVCSASHDFHNIQIDAREDRFNQRAKSWLDDLVTHLERDEINRNREKVLEINDFMAEQKKQFDDFFVPFMGGAEDELEVLTTVEKPSIASSNL